MDETKLTKQDKEELFESARELQLVVVAEAKKKILKILDQLAERIEKC